MQNEEMDEIVEKERKSYRDVEHVAGNKLKKIFEQAELARGLGLEEEFTEAVEQAKYIYGQTKENMEEQGRWNNTLKEVYKQLVNADRDLVITKRVAFDKFNLSVNDLSEFSRFLEKKFSMTVNLDGITASQLPIHSIFDQYAFLGAGKYRKISGTNIFILIDLGSEFSESFVAFYQLDEKNTEKLLSLQLINPEQRT